MSLSAPVLRQGMSGVGGPVGVLVLDKPPGITSQRAVTLVRRALGIRKVGHAGTLDPMASGVLVVGVGRATKLLTYITGADKRYEATIRLGQATTTDDADGEPVGEPRDATGLSTTVIADAMRRYVGDIEQVPSAVSAIKVNGRRAYALVRAGENVELKSRRVRVDRFALWEPADGGPLSLWEQGRLSGVENDRRSSSAGTHGDGLPAGPPASERQRTVRLAGSEPGVVPARRDSAPFVDLDVEVECSSGTYIRALARDLGRDLGVGGHLVALRRTRVGPFDVEMAADVDDVTWEAVRPAAWAARLIMPSVDVDARAARNVSYGRPLACTMGAQPTAVVGPDGDLLAIYQWHDGAAVPVVVLEPANLS